MWLRNKLKLKLHCVCNLKTKMMIEAQTFLPAGWETQTDLQEWPNQLTKQGQQATSKPHQQGHSHTARVLQDSLWWDEDPGSDDGPDDHGDTSEQGHLLPQFHLAAFLILPFPSGICPIWGNFVSICHGFSVSRCGSFTHPFKRCRPRFLLLHAADFRSTRLVEFRSPWPLWLMKVQSSDLKPEELLFLSPPSHQTLRPLPPASPPSTVQLSEITKLPCLFILVWNAVSSCVWISVVPPSLF